LISYYTLPEFYLHFGSFVLQSTRVLLTVASDFTYTNPFFTYSLLTNGGICKYEK